MVEWVDVFTRAEYTSIVLERLQFCQKEKGLEVYEWVIMGNHLHLIISRAENGQALSDIVRHFKKFTSSKIIEAIEQNKYESRRNWMLWIFSAAGNKNRNNTNDQFRKQDNYAEHLVSNKFMDQKLNYINMNPVNADIVNEPDNTNSQFQNA